MRIRIPFVIAYLTLSLVAGYLGFSSLHLPINDKLLHYITFFLLTLTFYWAFDTTRRRAVNFTFVAITLIFSILSEFLQGIINPSRPFDPYDILSNILGSLTALLLCAWYHKRMLSRKREKKTRYTSLATEDMDDVEGNTRDREGLGDAALDHGLDFEEAEELGDLDATKTRKLEEGGNSGGQ